MVGYYKGELCKCRHEQKYDEGIAKRHEERRHGIMCESSFLVGTLMGIFHGVGLETVNPEKHEHQGTGNLQEVFVMLIVDKIHDKAHAKTGYKRVYNITPRRADAGYEAIPASLVEGTLYTQYTDRSHRGRSYDPDKYSLEDTIKNIYIKWKWQIHNRVQNCKNYTK